LEFFLVRKRLRKIRLLRWTWRLGWKIFLFQKRRLVIMQRLQMGLYNLEAKISLWLISSDQKIGIYRRRSLIHRSCYFLMKSILPLLRTKDHLKRLSEECMGYAGNLWEQGKKQESLLWFLKAEKAKNSLARCSNWEEKNFIVLPEPNARSIGCMGHLDAFVKRKILTGDSRTYYLPILEEKIVNKDFLDYWSPYIQVVTNPEEIQKLSEYQSTLSVNWNWMMPGENSVDYVHYGMAKVQRQWYTEGRTPLLELNQSHRELAENQKKRWGMTDKDWFVCFDCRCSGYYMTLGIDNSAQDFRNSPIEDYYSLIEAITQEGGWVIRMGHPSSPKLSKQKFNYPDRVIDYAHLPERSSALDVALSATCRLFVSSPSGLQIVSKSFGVPSLYINAPMYRGFPHSPASIFIPPFYYSHDKDRVLTIEEIFSSNLVYADSQHHYDQLRVSLRFVEPEDMVSVLDEALSLTGDINFLKGNHIHHIENNFDRLNQKYEMCMNGRIGKNFLEKYKMQLGLME